MKYRVTKNQLLKKYQGIKHALNEKTRRLWCATVAMAIGKHGVAMDIPNYAVIKPDSVVLHRAAVLYQAHEGG